MKKRAPSFDFHRRAEGVADAAWALAEAAILVGLAVWLVLRVALFLFPALG